MEHELITVACNNCGAPLKVQDSTRFVTCTYCSSQLEIHRQDGAAYTEVLAALEAKTEQIEANTQQLTQKVDVLERQHRLEQLDREWQMEKEKYYSTDKHGRKTLPSRTGAICGAAAVLIAGVVIMALGGSNNSGASVFVGALAIAGSFLVGLYGLQKAEQYERARRRYEARRAAILAEISGRQDRFAALRIEDSE